MNAIKKQIGKRIRKARNEAGLTLAEVGKHLGMTAQAIETWESGSRSVSGEKLVRLARFLKVSPGSLMGERL